MILPGKEWLSLWDLRKRLALLPRIAHERPLVAEERGRDVFLIVGAVRSGNTLLRAMLMASEQVMIPPEAPSIPDVIAVWRRYSFLPWSQLVRVLIGEFLASHLVDDWSLQVSKTICQLEALPESRRTVGDVLLVIGRAWMGDGAAIIPLGFKDPYLSIALEQMRQVYPEVRVIHMLRDGRDSALSAVRAGIYGTLEAAARDWQRRATSCDQFGRRMKPRRFLEVRYEDLVRSEPDILPKICRFLDITFDNRMLQHQSVANDLGDSYRPHYAGIRRPVFTTSIGRWRHELTPEAQNALVAVLEPALSGLGYGNEQDDAAGADAARTAPAVHENE